MEIDQLFVKVNQNSFNSILSIHTSFRDLIHMETKKKHTEEVEELNNQISQVFALLPQFLQVYSQFSYDSF